VTRHFSGHGSAFRGLIRGVESDHDLVHALRERRPGAFDQLYRAYHGRIWRFLARLAGPGAEDLFQETWVAAARHVHHLREDTTLLPWLFTIARNKHRNGLRAWARHSRQRNLLVQAGANAQPSLDDVVDSHRRAAETQAALDSLPVTHREVLLLCVAENLETKAVAEILGCTSAVVRKRLSRARQELSRRMGKCQAERKTA
jgi:RNA polymerase sigma factor (sigma-70 family)